MQDIQAFGYKVRLISSYAFTPYGRIIQATPYTESAGPYMHSVYYPMDSVAEKTKLLDVMQSCDCEAYLWFYLPKA